MLRESFLNKYKEKSKYDDERFYQEDEGYLLKQNRPIRTNFMGSLKKEKVYKLIEDVLTHKKLTKVLYDSNAKIEIKNYNKVKKIFYKKKDEIERKLKAKNEPNIAIKRRSRQEAFIKIRDEISNYKINREKHRRNLTNSNNKRIKKLKEENEKEKTECFDDIRSNFIKGYRRAFSRLKFKLDILKMGMKGGVLVTEVDYPYVYEFIGHQIKFPNAKLKIKNVYSRLYNNAIILPKDYSENITLKQKHRKRAESVKHKIIEKTIDEEDKKVITKFKLKNAISSNQGKEFTIKINDSLFAKCQNKYSGGREAIKYLKTETNEKNNEEKNNYFVNYYNIVDPKTGNTFLHVAALENIPKMAQYFVDKGANINIQNKEGNTPLHLALKNNHNKVIKILMEKKAALDIPNSDGEIPFDYFTPDMKRDYGVDKILVINPTKELNNYNI